MKVYGEIDVRNCGFLTLLILYLFSVICYPYSAQFRPWAYSEAKTCGGARAMQSTLKPKEGF